MRLVNPASTLAGSGSGSRKRRACDRRNRRGQQQRLNSKDWGTRDEVLQGNFAHHT
jgi:hypothetical protein